MNTVSQRPQGIALRRSNDTDVLQRALNGDPVAFSEIYRRYHSRVYALCLSRLLSREAAEDATQEVFVRMLSSHADGIESPTAWLFGIARHVCIDVMRKSSRDAPAREEDVGAGEAPSADGTAEDAALSKRDAESALLALRRITPRYRSALILRDIHQLPMDDVAEALGVSVGTGYTILCRARDAFGTAYAETLGLPRTCRTAVELMFKRTGTGIAEGETAALEAHLATCPRCRKEAARAENGSPVNALLPLLPWSPSIGQGLLARAASRLGTTFLPAEPVAVGVSGVGVKIAAAIAAAGLVATAGVGGAVHARTENRAAEMRHVTSAQQMPQPSHVSSATVEECERTQAEYRVAYGEQQQTRLRPGDGTGDGGAAKTRTGAVNGGSENAGKRTESKQAASKAGDESRKRTGTTSESESSSSAHAQTKSRSSDSGSSSQGTAQGQSGATSSGSGKNGS